MTAGQPNAPAQPQAPAAPSARTAVPADLADQIDAANRAVEEAARRVDARAATAAQQAPALGRPGSVSVIKNGAGNVVVTTGDGRVVTIDPRVGLDADAVQNMVQTALAPPVLPEPARKGPSGEDVAIVSIIFPCLIVIMLIVWRIVATAKRAGAAVAEIPGELTGRLARIEQAIEAVAIEVERISESERYSARLLTERLPQPAAQGLAAAAPTADAVR